MSTTLFLFQNPTANSAQATDMASRPTPPPARSTTASPSPLHPITDDDIVDPPSPSSQTRPKFPTGPRPLAFKSLAFSSREDCWSEEATRTLIDAWGSHYLQLNRGNLRQKHWEEVSDAVNALHAPYSKLRRTDVQCKNRIDTTKKKYKIEKSRVVKSEGRYVSSWAHFESLDFLIGGSFSSNSNKGHSRNLRRRITPSPRLSLYPDMNRGKTTPAARHAVKDPGMSPFLKLPWSVPVGPRSKRGGPGSVRQRNLIFSAAAAMEGTKDDEGRQLGAWRRKRKTIGVKGYRNLAEAIGGLAHTFQKVEEAKQQQMVDLETQRMQFAKDLEIQRMNVLFESQVQLEKLKRAKRSLEKSKS